MERNAIAANLMLIMQREEYERRATQLQNEKIGQQRAAGLPDPIGPASGNDFADEVLKVLEAWNFPSISSVVFDQKKQDIVVNGKERADNGKGVRAILHSAFKVGFLTYCQKNNLPHPGIIILDSPLLTYRSPLKSKHGKLTEDEKQLSLTALNVGFYEHLNGLSGSAQIIVLENQDPPGKFANHEQVQAWSGQDGGGRQGFFPG